MGLLDVVIVTKNCGRILEKCLNSVLHSLPVNRLIAVDGGSTDNTRKILERYEALIVDDANGNRATARQKGIGAVETEWFAFVDSDVVLASDWFYHVREHMKSGVGGVCGVEVCPYVTNRMLRKLQIYSNLCYSVRKGANLTMAGLIRTEALRDIEIPSELHVFEDEYIQNHIKSKGYRIMFSLNAYCLHYKPVKNWDFKELIKYKAFEWKLGKFRPLNMIPEVVHGLIIKSSLIGRDLLERKA